MNNWNTEERRPTNKGEISSFILHEDERDQIFAQLTRAGGVLIGTKNGYVPGSQDDFVGKVFLDPVANIPVTVLHPSGMVSRLVATQMDKSIFISDVKGKTRVSALVHLSGRELDVVSMNRSSNAHLIGHIDDEVRFRSSSERPIGANPKQRCVLFGAFIPWVGNNNFLEVHGFNLY